MPPIDETKVSIWSSGPIKYEVPVSTMAWHPLEQMTLEPTDILKTKSFLVKQKFI